jgi:para-aminobenzoate synthetase component 1
MTKRKFGKFSLKNSDRHILLSWAMRNAHFSFLGGNEYPTLNGSFPEILFVGRRSYVESNENSFKKLNQQIQQTKDWLYGYFSYDLKNEIEALESNNPISIPINNLGFYVPEVVIQIKADEIIIESFDSPEIYYKEIHSSKIITKSHKQNVGPLTSSTSKRQYLVQVEKIKNAIVEGEFYEMNYCIEFSANATAFDPLLCFNQLNTISPMPFSSFMRIGEVYLICASPERFIKKEGSKIISQPIKGTTGRSFDKKEDEDLKIALKNSEKERAENLMIVDLVRNDLAKSAIPGTVAVDELFGIYSFKKVHQMISTVSATQNPKTSTTDIIKHAFPMGSMTGAPKIRVMQEIESLEHTARGLYSGSVGFFSPEQDFDFNVVIRSIIYNSENGNISFHVGSAITYDSDPEHEYNECLLKAESLLQVLS